MVNGCSNKTYGWFVFYKNQLLLYKEESKVTIPLGSEPPLPNGTGVLHTIGTYNEVTYLGYSLSELPPENEFISMVDLRSSYDVLPAELHQLAGRAFQLLHWDENSRFCPSCGTPTLQNSVISKKCPECHREIYPTISTAILALVRREDQILLVHAHSFTRNFHSLVAGFLEPGESLEECVKREVLEETGLIVNNVTYFGNQTWPYPSGLMVGFIADYESGEIVLQEEELSSGAFYTVDNLPELPGKLSLARKMIDWWIETQQSSSLSSNK